MGDGQFGTRLANGKDAASPRYIYAYTSLLANAMFNADDGPVLEYRMEEGTRVEPVCMAPCMPVVLLNGAAAIATGFSTEIPTFEPAAVLAAVRTFLGADDGEEVDFPPLKPFYRGFTGTVVEDTGPNRSDWRMEGRFSRSGNEVTITELPVGRAFVKAAEDFKAEDSLVRLVDDRSTETAPHMRLQFKSAEALEKAEKRGLERALGLVSAVSTKNMFLLDPSGAIKLYATTGDILRDWCPWRLQMYARRKEHLLDVAKNRISLLSDKHRFVAAVVARTIDVAAGDEAALTARLVEDGYARVGGTYNYLLDISIRTMTRDRCAKLAAELAAEREGERVLRATSPRQMWARELDAVEPLL